MTYLISQDGRTLTILVSESERNGLRIDSLEAREKNNGNFACDASLHEFFEPLVANSELQWIDPEWTGDLTDAPMLGILGDDVGESEVKTFPAPYHGWREIGFNGREKIFQPVLSRWHYAPYQLRSPLTDLLETGKCEFTN